MKTPEQIEERKRDAAQAMAEYLAHQEEVNQRTKRLRALRLAAADKQSHAQQSQTQPSDISEDRPVAVNKPVGDNARKGAVRKRTQLKTKMMGKEHWTKRSKESGRFMDQKAGAHKFKGVRREDNVG